MEEKQEEIKIMRWHDAEKEHPADRQLVVVITDGFATCGDWVECFDVAVFHKRVEYKYDEYDGAEYGEVRENVYSNDMWDYPDGEVLYWAEILPIPERIQQMVKDRLHEETQKKSEIEKLRAQKIANDKLNDK